MPTCIIMRGLPGSGKSTLAATLNADLGGIICSADHYFMVDGEYRYDPAQIGEAHKACRERFEAALAEGRSVIVDNTNTRTWEYLPYVKAAREAGYKVEVHEVFCAGSWMAELFAERCRHGVPVGRVVEMFGRWEPVPDGIPFFTYAPMGLK
jgi:predicted kinase